MTTHPKMALLCGLLLLLVVGCSGPETSCVEDSSCPGCQSELMGQPCGPCGVDRYVCGSTEEIVCSGQTVCGALCSEDSECGAAICHAGRCAPEGFAAIPAGRFLRGSPFEETGRSTAEIQHTVSLTRHFLLQSSEVTQGEWRRLMGSNPSFFDQCGPDCPVESVTWLDALAFANALSADHGFETCYDLSQCTGSPGDRFRCPTFDDAALDCAGYRLPTEAEWEYAYRADTTSAYYNGDPTSALACDQPLLDEIAHYCGNCVADYGQSVDCSNDGARPHMPDRCAPAPTAQLSANAWGLYDMAGNVEELVWDAFDEYTNQPLIDPTGPPHEDRFIVVRGASYCGHRSRLRAADRKSTLRTTPLPSLGFRLARTIGPASDDEINREGSCDNGCGGCLPLRPAPGSPCGPCRLNQLVCESVDTMFCDGATSCELGDACSQDSDCETDNCSNGHCSLPGQAFIPAGRYLRGSPGFEARRSEDELLHEVSITRHFFMDPTPVTQREWRNLLGYNPAYFKNCGLDCPIENISWMEAVAFANARSRLEGISECYDLSRCTGAPGDRLRCEEEIELDLDCEGYRLPTDAEWEYAYRADTKTAFFTGDATSGLFCDQPILEESAHYCGNCEVDYETDVQCNGRACGPISVGQKAPNPWGLYDMIGNVSEFVWDAPAPYTGESQVDPVVTSVDEMHITVRNAGFCGTMPSLRAAHRGSTTRISEDLYVGFRLVRTFRSATEEEMERPGSCSNGCGGCFPISPPPGTSCGTCGSGSYTCTSANSVACTGQLACNLAAPCSSDAQCTAGPCSNGHCTIPDFTYIPAGSFTMGSPPGERGRQSGESQFDVTLTRPFLMQTTETTQDTWTRAMGYNPSFFTACGLDCPVESLTWLDALAFANAASDLHQLPRCYDLSQCTGEPGNRFRCPEGVSFDLDCEGYRLPTEAEWEYAYRANTTSAYYTGESDNNSACEQPMLAEIAHFCGNCDVDYEPFFDCSGGGARDHMPEQCGTAPVATYSPNPWGLFDMSGNVAELVWDAYDTYPSGSAVDPIGPQFDGVSSVVRGAGFCGHLARLRAADRASMPGIRTNPGLGVRLVRSLPVQP